MNRWPNSGVSLLDLSVVNDTALHISFVAIVQLSACSFPLQAFPSWRPSWFKFASRSAFVILRGSFSITIRRADNTRETYSVIVTFSLLQPGQGFSGLFTLPTSRTATSFLQPSTCILGYWKSELEHTSATGEFVTTTLVSLL